MKELDQIELLNNFRAGDETAFEQVFKIYYKPLRLQAFLILKNTDEAEDQAQQLFLDIWKNELYRNIQQSLKAYLHMSIRNRCLNYLKKLSQEDRNWSEYAAQASANTFDEEEQPLHPNLMLVLNELPAQRSKALYLVHFENKKYQEAAEEMGISINSLKSHLKLALKFLRIRLKMTPIHPYNK